MSEMKDDKINETHAEQTRKKMALERSIISVPYSTPKSAFNRMKNFVTMVLTNRGFASIDQVLGDFVKLEPQLISLLTLSALDRLEFHLTDMILNIKLMADFDKASEDLNMLPLEVLGTTNCSEIGLNVHLRSGETFVDTIVEDLKGLSLQVIELRIAKQDDEKQGEAHT